MRTKTFSSAFGILTLGSALTLVGFLGASCGNSATTQISGTLNLTSRGRSIAFSRTATYNMHCVTLTGTPTYGDGTVNTDTGAFSLSLASATNVPIGCIVQDGDSNTVALVAFESSQTGLDGSNVREGSYVSRDGTTSLDFGTVTLDLDTGVAVIAKDDVVATGATGTGPSGSWADPTGTWAIASLPGSTPTGYMPVCSPDEHDCNGPHEGEEVYLRQYTATDGDGNTHYGLAVWGSEAAATSCSGEGATLPSGWSADSGSTALTTAPSLVNSFPAPSTITNSDGICNGSTSAACSSLTTDGAWGFTHAGSCQMYCTFQSLWNNESTGCRGQFFVDWANFFTAVNTANPSYSGSWTNSAANTSDPEKTTYFGGTVVFSNRPQRRHMLNELILVGPIGTVNDTKQEIRSVCSATDAQGHCIGSPVSCHVQQTYRLTFTQGSATEAVAELLMRTAVSPSDDAACSSDTHLRLGEQKMLFTLNKQ
ncbi:hypothetical protein K2X33_12510 [bacterium]|nr:hypothetical protein [bacterium]